MNKDYIDQWLNTPNQAFEGKPPLKMLEENEKKFLEKISEMIYYVKTGVPT